jgi:arylamine N-acetyltransferase
MNREEYMKSRQQTSTTQFTSINNDNYVAAYLDFLELEHEKPSLDYLRRLMQMNLYKIPYDGSNFALHQPEKVSLKNKVNLAAFREGRGSVCFQLSGAFCKLLNLLGFDAMLTSVMVMSRGGKALISYGEKGISTHCAIVVTFETTEYLVDCVWGNNFRWPLPLGEVQTQITGDSQRQFIKNGDWYQLQIMKDGHWEVEYELQKIPKRTKDFAEDIKFAAGMEKQGVTNHLAHKLLLHRRRPDENYERIWRDIYKDKNPSLFFETKLPGCIEMVKQEITDPDMIRVKLMEFGIDNENIVKIVGFSLK